MNVGLGHGRKISALENWGALRAFLQGRLTCGALVARDPAEVAFVFERLRLSGEKIAERTGRTSLSDRTAWPWAAAL